MKALKFIIPILIICLACNPDKVDTKAVKEDLKNQKIKKISEGDIMAVAGKRASYIADTIQKSISQNLAASLSKGGVEEAIGYCILSQNSLAKSLEKLYKAKVTRTNFPEKLRNPQNGPDAQQKEILNAYLYNLEKNLPLSADIQIKKNEIIYNSPIIIKEEMCLQCHGTPGEDISEKDYKKIKFFYLRDRSINYKMNDFMGLWTVRLNKQELIRGME